MLKKIILALLIAICFNCRNILRNDTRKDINEIEKFLSLNASFDRKVAQINDTIRVKIEFINHSNDTVAFFPVSNTYLSRLSNFFPGPKPLIVNLARDLRKETLLLPGENYTLKYRVEIDSTFFLPGMNDSLYVSYSFSGEHLSQNISKNILQGFLISDPLILEIKTD